MMNREDKVVMVWGRVKEYLRVYLGMEVKVGNSVPFDRVVEGIMAVRGIDDRTVRKWLREFQLNKCIKYVHPNRFLILR